MVYSYKYHRDMEFFSLRLIDQGAESRENSNGVGKVLPDHRLFAYVVNKLKKETTMELHSLIIPTHIQSTH